MSKDDTREYFDTVILAAVGGLFLTAGYALHPFWWAPWLAPALLIVAGSGSGRNAVVAGAIAGAASLAS